MSFVSDGRYDGPINVPLPRNSVKESLLSLHDELEMLANALTNLEATLDPILAPRDAVESVKSAEARIRSSETHSRTLDAIDIIIYQRARVSVLNERLEV
jgi:hypothetical protein